MVNVFSSDKKSGPNEAELKEQHARIERLAIEDDFLFEGLKGW